MTDAIDAIELAKRALADNWAPNIRDVARDLARAVLALEKERDDLRDLSERQAERLLDPDATCCADATRKTREMRLAHETQLTALRAALRDTLDAVDDWDDDDASKTQHTNTLEHARRIAEET